MPDRLFPIPQHGSLNCPVPPCAEGRDRIRWFVALAGVAAIGACYLGLIRNGHVWGDDFALYVRHAENIAAGREFGQTGYIYNPHNPEVGPPSYPPLFPLLLSPVVGAFGLNFTAMKVGQIAILLLFLTFLFVYFTDTLSFWERFALVWILAMNRYFLSEVNSIGSDVPFLLWAYLALWVMQRGYRSPAGPGWPWGLGVGAVMYVAYGTRTVGLALLPTLLVYELMRARRVRHSVLIAAGTFLALAILQGAMLGGERRYVDQLGQGWSVLAVNAARYLTRFAAFWHNGVWMGGAAVVGAAVGAVSLLGLVDTLRRRVGLNEVFGCMYLAVVFAWPTYCDGRLLYPVMPLYLCYFFRGLSLIARRGKAAGEEVDCSRVWPEVALEPRGGPAKLLRLGWTEPWFTGGRVAAGLLLASMVSSLAVYFFAAGPITQAGPVGVGRADAQEMFQFVRRKTAANAVCVFVKPRALALFTDRASSVYHMPGHADELWDYFASIGAGYLIVVQDDGPFEYQVDPRMLTYLREFAMQNAEKLVEIYANSGFRIYEIRHGRIAWGTHHE